MQGLAFDGGLYMPAFWPSVNVAQSGSYIDTAHAVLAPFMNDIGNLRQILENTYSPRPDGFAVPEITPLKQLDDKLGVLELFHGPTLAFKDVALQLLGRLFDNQLKKTGASMTILGATSGDTGSAAIEGCRHAAGTKIFILYPDGKPSAVQRKQMTTVQDRNVHAIAIKGSFDDCQAIVKTLFADADFKNAHQLSAVNSINWARIAAQIVYYFGAARRYSAPVNFVVPTGNFGNVFAAYAAKKMGANIARLIVASNRNDILTRFFETGIMQISTVEPSLSPSMDIQVSSNFERLLFDVLGHDFVQVKAVMESFQKTGVFTLPENRVNDLRETFSAVRCSDVETMNAIKNVQRQYNYTIDPHTAVGFHAYEVLKNTLVGPVVTLACAYPAKFPDAVFEATGTRPPLPENLDDLYERPERITVLPNSADAIRDFIKTH
jgi:threonine synthase